MPLWAKVLLSALVGFGLTFLAQLGIVASDMSDADTLASISVKEWINILGPAGTAMLTTIGAYLMKSPKEPIP